MFLLFFGGGLSRPNPCRSLSCGSLIRFLSCFSCNAQERPLGARRILLWMVHDRTQCARTNIYVLDAPHGVRFTAACFFVWLMKRHFKKFI